MPESTQTPAAGGVLTQQQVAALLLQPLQAASVFLAAGPRIFDTNGGNSLRIPRITGSTGAGFVAEGALIPDDDVTFGELVLLPKQMKSAKVITRVSDELLRQSVVALDSALRARLVNDVAVTLDTAFIASSVSDGTQPLGILNYAGIQTIAHSAAVSLDLLHDMLIKLLIANVDSTGARWLMTPFVFGALRKLKDGQNRYQLEPDPTLPGGFRVLGYPITVTPRIPTVASTPQTTKIVLYVPSMIAVARDINPEVKVLTERYADTGQVGIRVQARYDALPMYPEAVVVATGVTGA